jgi:hypothetical protein
MKSLIVSALALFSLSAHADVTGSVEVVVSGDRSPGFSDFQVNEDGGNLVGISGAQVNLEKQTGGYKGFAFGRPFNLNCLGDVCTDNGSTQAQFTVKYLSGGFTLDGSLNFVSVHATVTDQTISLSTSGFNTDVSFDLNRNSNGSFSGDGVFGASNPFTATVTAEGSLAGLKDPAAFIVLVVSPFVRN